MSSPPSREVMTTEHEDLEWLDEAEELADVLRDALSDEFTDASPEEMDDALFDILESMNSAEAYNFTKALQQIGKGAGKSLSDPLVGQIVRTAMPVVGGATGTIIAGPAGTALGAGLGNSLGKSLPGGQPSPSSRASNAAASAGSVAAAKGLLLTQKPEVLQSLLALSLGQKGQKVVNGIPVASVMSMLSNVFGQAAADADELMYLNGDSEEEPDDAYYGSEPVDNQLLYTALMEAESIELAESEDWR